MKFSDIDILIWNGIDILIDKTAQCIQSYFLLIENIYIIFKFFQLILIWNLLFIIYIVNSKILFTVLINIIFLFKIMIKMMMKNYAKFLFIKYILYNINWIQITIQLI